MINKMLLILCSLEKHECDEKMFLYNSKIILHVLFRITTTTKTTTKNENKCAITSSCSVTIKVKAALLRLFLDTK